MKLNTIRDFLAVAERGSMRAAGRHLDVAQPALSRSIQELEKELGVALFERQTKGVTLTPMGEAFLRRAKAVRSELTRAKDEIDQMRGELHGSIRVCLSTAAHMALMPNALGPFRQRYPDVVVNIVDALLPSVEQELKDGTVDCYVGPAFESVPSELTAEKLFDSTRVILGRKGHPLAHAKSLVELVDAEWVTTSVTHRVDDELTPLFTQHGLPAPKVVVQAHSAFSFLFAVAYSDLLMVLPVQWTRAPLFRDALQIIPVKEVPPTAPICIVKRTGLPLTPAAEYFCDMMRRASEHMDNLVPPAPSASAASSTSARQPAPRGSTVS
jgi:LysR family transcriptional regulator, regulator of abg operon